MILCVVAAASGGAAAAPFSGDPEYVTRTWETGDGLPENSATAIAQSPDGYLWFGTFEGLVRFNGSDFRVFNPENTPELPSAGIVNLHLDKAGRLIVSTYRGLAVREGRKWLPLPQEEIPEDDFVRTFAERPNGDILLTTFNGRLVVLAGGALHALPAPPGEQGQGYFGGVDEDGQWWAAQSGFIGRWKDGKWERMISPQGLPSDGIALSAARDGGLWLLLGDQLLKLRRGVEVARLTLPENPGGIWCLSEDSLGNVWIATYDRGFCRVSPDGRMMRWTALNGWSNAARCAFEDREGTLWLGTSGDGLIHLRPRRFRQYPLLQGQKGLVAHSIAADFNGGIWAATYGHGLFHLSETGAVSVVYGTNETPYLQSVHADRTGRLWLGRFGRELLIVDKNATREVHSPQVSSANVIALFEDKLGRVWFSGGRNAIANSDGVDLEVLGPAEGLSGSGFGCFSEDTAGRVWVAGEAGVFRRERGHRFVEMKDAAGQSIQGITCLKRDAVGAMWMGSRNRGLLRWQNGQLDGVWIEQGLNVGAVQSVVEDELGFFWMTSGRVIVRAALNDLQAVADGVIPRLHCQVFDANDGLTRNGAFGSGRQPATACDTRGRLWFTTTKGVVMIDPASLRLNGLPPQVHIEEISFQRPASSFSSRTKTATRLWELPANLQSPFDRPVVLAPGSHRLEIVYAGLSLAAPEKVRYQFKLEPRDLDWQDVGSLRVAHFEELSPGDYIFRVRAANNDGVWNQTGASLAFTLEPFYWQTVWFRIGLGLLLVGLGAVGAWLWAQTHIRRALEREQAANEIRDLAGRLINAQEEERSRLGRELHDDITQRLARLAIDVSRCEIGTGHGTPAEMARDVRSGLVQLSQDVHALSYRLHSSILEDLGLAEAIKAEVERFQQQHSVPVKMDLPKTLEAMPREAGLCLFRVAQEALRNIGRHARAHAVQVSLRASAEGVQLAVQDDGCGFNPALRRKKPSLGLASMKERVLLVGGELDIESTPGHGTTVLAWVPVGKVEG